MITLNIENTNKVVSIDPSKLNGEKTKYVLLHSYIDETTFAPKCEPITDGTIILSGLSSSIVLMAQDEYQTYLNSL